jgi:hypothetical protein
MKHVPLLLVVLGFSSVASAVAHGALSEGVYWADEVSAWTGNVMNFGGELMTDATTWWLTGRPDADVDGNGYAWDPVDHDYVGGWRHCGSSGDESFTVYFEAPIRDVDGPDLMIHKYAGPNAAASVWASSEDADYVQVAELGGGAGGYFVDVWVDLAGLADDVHYVRVVREANGPQTATFVDALGAPLPSLTPFSVDPFGPVVPATIAPVPPPPGPSSVPEPGTAVPLALGCLALAVRRR